MTENKKIILSCDHLVKKYQNGGMETSVLNGIHLVFYRGSMNLIYGKSGSGKTTLLNLLASLDSPTDGDIIFEGKKYGEMTEKELAGLRGKHFGFVFQAYHLIPQISIKDNIICPGYINRTNIDDNYYWFLMEQLGIENLEKKRPHQLSGGEQQRAAIARAMILKPDIVFADEPTGNLDSENTKSITDLFEALNREYHTTFIIVTHEENLIDQCDQTILIKDGEVSETQVKTRIF